jgi:hypothetical protein
LKHTPMKKKRLRTESETFFYSIFSDYHYIFNSALRPSCLG